MSSRYTAMYVAAAGTPTTILFTTKAVQAVGVAFQVNVQRITFATAELDFTGVDFNIEKGPTNYDNGFMAF